MSALSNLATYKPHRSQTNPSIRLLLQTHRHYLKTHPDTQTWTVDHEKAAPFYYNLFAYLQEAGLALEVHYATLLLSELDSPEQFDHTTDELIVPSLVVVESIIADSGL